MQEVVWTRQIARFYVLHLIFQLTLEILFLWLLNFLQQFQHNTFGVFVPTVYYVPEEFQCHTKDIKSTFACHLDDGSIPCLVPRSFDKTVQI